MVQRLVHVLLKHSAYTTAECTPEVLYTDVHGLELYSTMVYIGSDTLRITVIGLAELCSYIPSVPPLPSPPLSPMGILVCAKGGGRPSVRETCTMESLSTEGNTRNQQTTVTYL